MRGLQSANWSERCSCVQYFQRHVTISTYGQQRAYFWCTDDQTDTPYRCISPFCSLNQAKFNRAPIDLYTLQHTCRHNFQNQLDPHGPISRHRDRIRCHSIYTRDISPHSIALPCKFTWKFHWWGLITRVYYSRVRNSEVHMPRMQRDILCHTIYRHVRGCKMPPMFEDIQHETAWTRWPCDDTALGVSYESWLNRKNLQKLSVAGVRSFCVGEIWISFYSTVFTVEIADLYF